MNQKTQLCDGKPGKVVFFDFTIRFMYVLNYILFTKGSFLRYRSFLVIAGKCVVHKVFLRLRCK